MNSLHNPSLSFHLKCIITITLCLALNASLTSPDPIEEAKLVAILTMLMLELLMFYIAISVLNTEKAIKVLNLSFSVMTFIVLSLVITGGAEYTASGRLQGVFRTSNALAAFLVMNLCLIIGTYGKRLIIEIKALSSFLVAFFLLFLSGSRASMVIPFILIIGLLLLKLHRIQYWIAAFIFMSIFSFAFDFEDIVIQVSDFLYVAADYSGFNSLNRIAQFTSTLASADNLSIEQFDDSRSAINSAVMMELTERAKLLGYGLETSQQLTSFDIKPHNIFLYVWYEMGLIPLVAIILFFIIPLWKCLDISKVYTSSFGKRYLMCILIGTFFLSIKTAFALQTGTYWGLILIGLVLVNRSRVNFKSIAEKEIQKIKY